jgi:hypothetical protein
MSDIDDLLAAIDARKRKFGCMLRPPASPGAVERVRRAVAVVRGKLIGVELG